MTRKETLGLNSR